jgi:ent-kaurene synthase
MVPLQGFPQAPCFPECVEWILQNQGDDGSWGIKKYDPSPTKCGLLSTLACIIALKKWNVGPEHVTRGLHFIGTNFSNVMDENILPPIGFNISFTGMINLAIGMGLQFPVEQTDVDACLQLRQMELKSFVGDTSYGRESYIAYIAEGLGDILDWNEVMKFQRKNGSLFNSPSATAAALIFNYDDKALQYLNLLVSKFGGSVPTVFPVNIYCQLSMVDSLEKTGISRYFLNEIKSILDMTYSLWLERDEEIMLDVATCAMAFRILRMNGYDVSSDELSHVAKASGFNSSLQGYLNDTRATLELYKASRVSVSKKEQILDNISYWSRSLLMEKMSSNEVEYALKFPFYAKMERVDHRRNIEHFYPRDHHILKMPYL